MYCPNCGKQNEEKNKFCLACGERFPQAAKPPAPVPINPVTNSQPVPPPPSPLTKKIQPQNRTKKQVIIFLAILVVLAGGVWAGLRWIAPNNDLPSWQPFIGNTSAVGDISHLNLPQGALTRLGKGTMKGVNISPDQKTLVLATSFGVWFYDIAQLNFLKYIPINILEVAWSQNGLYLLTSSGLPEGTVLVDLTKMEIKFEVNGTSPFWSPVGKYFITTTGYGSKEKVMVWDTATGEQRLSFVGKNPEWALKGNILKFTTSIDSKTEVWNIDTKTQILDENLIDKYDMPVFHTKNYLLSPDGRWAIQPSLGERSVMVVDIVSNQELFKTDGRGLWSPDGHFAVFLDYAEEKIKIFDPIRREVVFTAPASGNSTWSSDGKSIAFFLDHDIMVYDVATWQKRQSFTWVVKSYISDLYWVLDNKKLIARSATNDMVLWDVDNGQAVEKLTGFDYLSDPLAVAWAPNGQYLAIGGMSQIAVWDVKKEKLVWKTDSSADHHGRSLNIKWSPDGSKLAIDDADGVWTGDEKLSIWNTKNWKIEFSLPGSSGPSWSPDGKRLATGSADKVTVWDTATWTEIRTLRGLEITGQNNIFTSSFSPDGKLILFSSYGNNPKTIIWDLETGSPSLVMDGMATTGAWSPDGRKIIGSGMGGREGVGVWDAKTGAILWQNNEVQYGILSSWSPDGRQIAMGLTLVYYGGGYSIHDNDVLILDAGTGEIVDILKGHRDKAIGVSWSPDGQKNG